MLRPLHIWELDSDGLPKINPYTSQRQALPEAEQRPKTADELSDEERRFFTEGIGFEVEERHKINVARWALERQALFAAAEKYLREEADE